MSTAASIVNLRESLLSLQPGVSLGIGSPRNEFLIALGERMSDGKVKLLEDMGVV